MVCGRFRNCLPGGLACLYDKQAAYPGHSSDPLHSIPFFTNREMTAQARNPPAGYLPSTRQAAAIWPRYEPDRSDGDQWHPIVKDITNRLSESIDLIASRQKAAVPVRPMLHDMLRWPARAGRRLALVAGEVLDGLENKTNGECEPEHESRTICSPDSVRWTLPGLRTPPKLNVRCSTEISRIPSS
jgi:hypothetical protein